MARGSRYRTVGETSCIDLRLRTARQLFDLRDPAPFRERDLDPSAAAHILASIKEIPRRRSVKLVLQFSDPGEPSISEAVLREAVASQFGYERDLVTTRIRENFQNGERLAVLGVFVLALFLSLAEVTRKAGFLAFLGAPTRQIASEGLTIMAWVAMWRPAEVLLYGWWPLLAERRWLDKAARITVEVRHVNASVVPRPAASP